MTLFSNIMPNKFFLKTGMIAIFIAFSSNLVQAQIEVAFSPGKSLNTILNSIDQAQDEILIAAYSFTSRPISKAIVDAKNRGVKISVLADKKANTSGYTATKYLKIHQIPICLTGKYKIMHNKFMIIDKSLVQTGSFNYSHAAVKSNAENVITIRDEKVALIYAEEFFRLWKECQTAK